MINGLKDEIRFLTYAVAAAPLCSLGVGAGAVFGLAHLGTRIVTQWGFNQACKREDVNSKISMLFKVLVRLPLIYEHRGKIAGYLAMRYINPKITLFSGIGFFWRMGMISTFFEFFGQRDPLSIRLTCCFSIVCAIATRLFSSAHPIAGAFFATNFFIAASTFNPNKDSIWRLMAHAWGHVGGISSLMLLFYPVSLRSLAVITLSSSLTLEVFKTAVGYRCELAGSLDKAKESLANAKNLASDWDVPKDSELFPIKQKIIDAKEVHQIFGLQSNFSQESYKAAYYNLMLQLHPDKMPVTQSDELCKAVTAMSEYFSKKFNQDQEIGLPAKLLNKTIDILEQSLLSLTKRLDPNGWVFEINSEETGKRSSSSHAPSRSDLSTVD